MYCRSCGNELNESSLFCKNCGELTYRGKVAKKVKKIKVMCIVFSVSLFIILLGSYTFFNSNYYRNLVHTQEVKRQETAKKEAEIKATKNIIEDIKDYIEEGSFKSLSVSLDNIVADIFFEKIYDFL